MSEPRAEGLRQALELFEVAEALVEQRLIREAVPPAVREARLREWRLARPQAARRRAGSPCRSPALPMTSVARALAGIAATLDERGRR